jgi:hypothetical protein
MCVGVCVWVCMYMYMHTSVSACIHTHRHRVYVHTFIHTCIRAYIWHQNSYIHALVCWYIRFSCLHMLINHRGIHMRTYACIHITSHAYICVHTHHITVAFSHTHTQAHTWAHTHTHTHTHTSGCTWEEGTGGDSGPKSLGPRWRDDVASNGEWYGGVCSPPRGQGLGFRV